MMGELHVDMHVTLTAQDAGYPYPGWELLAIIEEADALLLGRTTW